MTVSYRRETSRPSSGSTARPELDEVAFAGAARQAELLAAGELSSVELVSACLERIGRLDPRVNAFRVVLRERALAEAEAADRERGAGSDRPLLGVPLAVKDDLHVSGERAAMGARANGPSAIGDSEVVRRLREAGAVIVGKTNMPQLSAWPFTESMAWGETRNPWDLSRTPGGSSGGSAAAVAAGLVGGALGSDGGGSIRVPAAACGIFGLKPERGRVPVEPQQDWSGLTAVGPLTRTVLDAGIILDALSIDSGEPRFADAARARPGALRIAWSPKSPLPSRPTDEVMQSLEATIGLLRGLGHLVERRDPGYRRIAYSHVLPYFAGVHDAAENVPRRALEARTRSLVRIGAASRPLVPFALRLAAANTARMLELFEDFDVLVTPVVPGPPPEAGRWRGRGALRTLVGVSRTWPPFTMPWNLTGQPAASVPAGIDASGLPLGVQLVARPNGEATLLSLAAQLEAERPWATSRPSHSVGDPGVTVSDRRGRGRSDARLALNVAGQVANAGLLQSKAAATRAVRRWSGHLHAGGAESTDFDPLDPEVLADPYPRYARLLETGPLHYNPARDEWLLTRHSDVRDAARAHDKLSSSEGVTSFRSRLPMMLTSDRPDHMRLRRLVAGSFTRDSVERWLGDVERLAGTATDEMLERGVSDAVSLLAAPLPVAVIALVLGVPADRLPEFRQWSDRIVEGFGAAPGSGVLRTSASVFAATVRLHSYMLEQFERRRREPGEDLLSELLASSEEGQMSADELFWFAFLLLVAGNETTTNLLGSMILALAENPGEYHRLRGNPELIGGAVEEALRYSSPIQGFYRTAISDYPVGDATVPGGGRVLLLFGAANRDPRRYPDPDRFDPARKPSDHLAFGTGIHFCLGAHLARLEAEVVLRELIDRVVSIELVGEPRWRQNPALRGPASLPVRLRPALG